MLHGRKKAREREREKGTKTEKKKEKQVGIGWKKESISLVSHVYLVMHGLAS